MDRKKLIPFFVSFFIISLLAIAFYFQSSKNQAPSASPTSSNSEKNTNLALESKDWKIYADSALKFRLRYPESVYQVASESGKEYYQKYKKDPSERFSDFMGHAPPKDLGGVGIFFLEKEEITAGNQTVVPIDGNQFTIRVFDNPQELTIDEWYEKYQLFPFRFGQGAPALEETIAINEIEGKTITREVPDFGKRKFVLLSKDNHVFLIKIFSPTKEKEQMLSTLEFSSTTPSQKTEKSSDGVFCGGFAGVACPEGHRCVLDGNYPDAGGKCESK